MTRRTGPVYLALLTAWVLIAGWQSIEHRRIRQVSRVALINHAVDISTSLGVVMRSQRRFGGIISKDRLESALNALIKPGHLNAILLLNDEGEIVASAGAPVEFQPTSFLPAREHWGQRTLTLVNPVDLGTNITREADGTQPTIVVSRDQLFPNFGSNRPPREATAPGRPANPNAPDNEPDLNPGNPPPGDPPPPPRDDDGTNRPPRMRGWPPRGPDGRAGFGRPFWMSEAEYKALLDKKGVHSFVVELSTDTLRTAATQDLWLRALVCTLALVSAAGFGLAWRNVGRSAELEVRLVRAAELNARLKEMNLAAAGLAHETRNPLNIIRGLAQMISRQEDASTAVRTKSRDIIDESDRLTAQLNEFINYSRPREVRRSRVALDTAVNEVVRALNSDIEEKTIRLEIAPSLPVVEADEQLLRQALFNLLINAIQAVERNGTIHVAAERVGPDEIQLDLRDDGPGVPSDQRTEIFKPYVTTHAEGTGLGLAVVQQIVLAHGWEIECLPNQPRGALFRISHIRPAPATILAPQ